MFTQTHAVLGAYVERMAELEMKLRQLEEENAALKKRVQEAEAQPEAPLEA